MPDRLGPPTLSLALNCVLGAAVEGHARTGLLAVVRCDDPSDDETGAGATTARRVVVPFPSPRSPLDDGPSAA